MDPFGLIVFISLTVAFLTFVALGLAWRREPIADTTDRKINEQLAAQANIEERDIPEMIDASNEYRRKRGQPTVTVEQFKRRIGREQIAILDEANKQQQAKHGGGHAATREWRGF